MKKWFKASDSKIYDLSIFECFWIERKNPGFFIYGLTNKEEYLFFNNFDEEVEAKYYLERMFTFLKEK